MWRVNIHQTGIAGMSQRNNLASAIVVMLTEPGKQLLDRDCLCCTLNLGHVNYTRYRYLSLRRHPPYSQAGASSVRGELSA